MCTLVLAWQVFDDAPIAVAANRDEALGRPSEPPGRYLDEPRAIAPRDATAGGTWIGYNERGLVVGITNRWVDRDGERSRGRLVADCLGCSSANEAIAHVRASVGAETYAGFNLVVVDADRAAVLEWDGDFSVTDFEPGVHVVVNVGADGDFFEPDARPAVGRQQAANARRLRVALDPAAGYLTAGNPAAGDTVDGESDADDESAAAGKSVDEWVDRAGAALGDHEYGVCVHGDGFGTRSASLIVLEAVDGSGVEDHYWFADGPPCSTAFRRVESRL